MFMYGYDEDILPVVWKEYSLFKVIIDWKAFLMISIFILVVLRWRYSTVLQEVPWRYSTVTQEVPWRYCTVTQEAPWR